MGSLVSEQDSMSMASTADLFELDASLATVLAQANPPFAEKFYQNLFARFPKYRAVFGNKDISLQGSMLGVALQTLVEYYIRPDFQAHQYLRLLGQKHHSKHIAPQDYTSFFQVLLDEITLLHGANWTPTLAKSWQASIHQGVKVMLEGCAELPAELSAFQAKQFEVIARVIHGLNARTEYAARIMKITDQVNQGVALDDVLDYVYDNFREVIPYNRIGLALVSESSDSVSSRWVRSDRHIYLSQRFQARLEHSTLAEIAVTGRSRILNDLDEYLRDKPDSISTQLIVKEGMKSSLTCPLITYGKLVGFLFFSSIDKNIYQNAHVEIFRMVAGQLSTIVEKAWLYSQLRQQATVIEARNREFDQGLEVARKLQRSMIPSQGIQAPHLTIKFTYQPTTKVGGDFFDVVDLEDGGKTMVLIADAMGHGVQAAMIAAAVKTIWNNARRVWSDPARVLGDINIELCDLVDDQMVTAVCAVLDPLRHELHVSCAGHPRPWRCQATNKSVNQVGEPAMALGLEKQATYRSHRYSLEPGDTVVFVTDGILEAFNHISEHFGEERIEQLLADQARAPVADLLSRLQDELWSFAGDRDLDDDLTILIARVGDGRRQEKEKQILTMTNRILDLGPMLDHLEELLLNEQAPSGFAGEVRLLAEEAIGNIIRYAYVDDKEYTIKVTLSWTAAGVQLEICDNGIAFNPLEAPLPDLEKPTKEREEGGLGIMLMKSIANEVSYSRVGDTNNLILIKEFIAA